MGDLVIDRRSAQVVHRTVGWYWAEKFWPPVVTDVVSRARLHPLVTASSGGPVTVVAAAAGWGKTIFAASWLRAGNAGRKGVWVSLEEADDDPHAFWCAVAAGLLPVVPARAGEALRRVAAGAVAAEELPGKVAAALRLAPDPIAVVLDNLHELSSPEVHQGLVRLVERAPSNLSLLVTTRRDPPWPLPRLRLAGLVGEIRAADLAFRTAMCAFADVASNTICGATSCRSSQSTPAAEASIPWSRALASPSDSTTPTMYRTSISSLRSSFASRSVPMFPGPTIAAVTLLSDMHRISQPGADIEMRLPAQRDGTEVAIAARRVTGHRNAGRPRPRGRGLTRDPDRGDQACGPLRRPQPSGREIVTGSHAPLRSTRP
jgi:hypothetical protein